MLEKVVERKKGQRHAECKKTPDNRQPREYENTLVLVSRRRGNADHHVQSAEHVSKKLNHFLLIL